MPKNLEKAIKALKVTSETVLFIDLKQIPMKVLEACEHLPDGVLVVGVMGPPNVEAMTREGLQAILDQKK